MKILHLVEFYSPSVGGAQEVVKQLSEHMVLMGHSVTVATTKLSERQERKINGVIIRDFSISGNSVNGFKGEIDNYKNFLISSNFDVIMVYAAQQWTADLFFEVMKNVNGRKVFVPCGFSALYDPLYTDYFEKMPSILNRFDATVYLSNDYRDINFARKHGIKNIRIIPNGVDEREFLNPPESNIRKKLGIPNTHFLILTIGSHTGLKGHLESFQIFKKLKMSHLTLLIIGNRTEDGCYEMCRKLTFFSKLDPRLFLRHKQIKNVELSRTDTLSAYDQSDLLLFPSNLECSPLVLFEAGMAKLPFVSSNVGNAKEIAQCTGGGVILKTKHLSNGKASVDINAASAVIEKVLKDKNRFKKMGNHAHDVVSKRFTWKIISTDYSRLYQSLLKK